MWPLLFIEDGAGSGWLRARRLCMLLVALGLLQAAVPSASLSSPVVAGWLSRTPLQSLDASYTGMVSDADLPREPTYSWTERVCEYHGWSGFGASLDSLLRDAGVGRGVTVVSTEYGLAFGLSRYAGAVKGVVVTGDPRFARIASLGSGPRVLVRRAASPRPPPDGARRLGVLGRGSTACASVACEFYLLR